MSGQRVRLRGLSSLPSSPFRARSPGVQRQKSLEDLLVGQVRRPPAGGEDRLVEALVGEAEAGGAPAVRPGQGVCAG